MFLQQIKLDKRFENFKRDVYYVWEYIGADCGAVGDNEEAIEVCLDADRLLIYIDAKESYEFMKEILRTVSFRRFIKFLSKEVFLSRWS